MSFKKYKLKDLVENFSVRARDYGGSDGLEFLGVSNDDGIVKSKSAAEHKGEEYKIIEKGCFAYNPYRINIGSIAYHNEDIKGLISPAYVIFKTKANSIKDNLLFKFLKSAEGLRQINFYARGTVRKALRFEDLCEIEISVPSFEDQENLITNIEKTEFETIQIFKELTHQLDLIKQLRQAFLREAMQGKLLNPVTSSAIEKQATGHELLAKIKAEKAQLMAEKKLKKEKELPPITADEIPFEIPKHWAWCRLGAIVNLITSGSRDWAKYYSSEGDIFLRMGNLSRDSFKLRMNKIQYVKPPKNKEGNRTRLEEGDILVSITGEVGNLGLIPKNFGEAYINQHTALVRLNREISIEYICYLFLSEIMQKQFNAPQRGMKNSFRLSDIDFLLIPFPPLHEQEQIVAKLAELMAFCDGLEQSNKESQGHNEMLLQQVLREALQAN